MIKTKPFAITRVEFFKLLLEQHFRTKWWVYLLYLAAVASILLKKDVDNVDFLFAGAFIVLILFQIVLIWKHAHSKDNGIFFIERHYEIDEDTAKGFLVDGTFSNVKLQLVFKTKEVRGYYLLYIAKNQFLFIPKTSFKSDEDRNWFESKVIGRLNSK